MTGQTYIEPVASRPDDHAVPLPLADSSGPSVSPVTSGYPHLSYTTTAVCSTPSRYVVAGRAITCPERLTLPCCLAGPTVCLPNRVRPSSSHAHLLGRLTPNATSRKVHTLQFSINSIQPAATHSSDIILDVLVINLRLERPHGERRVSHGARAAFYLSHPKPLRHGLHRSR